jgi:hypothetical protein
VINRYMSTSIESIAEKVFNILKGFGYAVNSYDASGQQSVDPANAVRFVVNKPNILVRLDSETDTLSLSTEKSLSEHQIRKMLKNLAHDSIINFDYKIFGKTIKPKTEGQRSEQTERDMAEVMEGFGTMTGSSKTSYQPLDNVKLVVKHKKPVSEEVRGARSRNIHSIYIQRGEERFRMSENNLAAARAMARHVQLGGEVYDSVGESISNMAADYRKLNEFVRYVKNANLINESNQEYVTLALENIDNIRQTFKKLSGSKSYKNTVESLSQQDSVEILEDDIDLQDKFTETHFDNRVAEVLGTLKTLSYRKKSFESYITTAIKKESFSNLKDMLSEADVLDFSTPHSKLGYQVSKLGYAASNPQLATYLQGLSRKIESGGQLNQFEYGTIKSCLLGANSSKPSSPTSGDFGITESYTNFLQQFDI